MSQTGSIKKLTYYPFPDSFRIVNANRSELSLSWYICSHETGDDICESEGTAKTYNPEFMKAMGVLYRTTETARAEEMPVDSFLCRLTRLVFGVSPCR